MIFKPLKAVKLIKTPLKQFKAFKSYLFKFSSINLSKKMGESLKLCLLLQSLFNIIKHYENICKIKNSFFYLFASTFIRF